MRSHPDRILILRSRDGLDEHLESLRGGPLAVDTETSGLRWAFGDRVGTINLAARRTAVVALGDALKPVARWLSQQVRRERELVFHNAKFDLHMLRATFDLHVPYPVHDTKVESFLVDNRGANARRWTTKTPHSLKPLAQVLLGGRAVDREAELLKAIKASGGKHKGDWAVLLGSEHEDLFLEYSAYDPWYTLELHRHFYRRILDWRQPFEHMDSLLSLYELEQWVLLAFRDMEARGIATSREFLEDWRITELEPKKRDLERQLAELAGRTINWNSTPELQRLLYGKSKDGGLGIPIERRSEKTRAPSTDAVALLDMSHPIGAVLHQYRTVFKQWSSYATSLVESIAADGAIHPNFNSTGAETGRTSCNDPNLQQQTRTSGVRKAYHPRQGLVLRFADYSQVEMRLAAHFGREPALIQGFNDDPDFDTHDSTARRMFGKSYDPKTQHRKYAKILNFTTIFGGGEAKVTEQLIDLMEYDEAVAGCRAFGIKRLSSGESPWRVLAHELKTRYKQTMPNLLRALRQDADEAERRGYAMHDFGGHRYFDDRFYRAFNTRVQGTAGVQAKKGLVRVYRESQLKRGELALMLLIHDELVYESDGDPAVDRRVLKLMAELTRFRVPIIADVSGSSTNWQEKTKVKL